MSVVVKANVPLGVLQCPLMSFSLYTPHIPLKSSNSLQRRACSYPYDACGHVSAWSDPLSGNACVHEDAHTAVTCGRRRYKGIDYVTRCKSKSKRCYDGDDTGRAERKRQQTGRRGPRGYRMSALRVVCVFYKFLWLFFCGAERSNIHLRLGTVHVNDGVTVVAEALSDRSRRCCRSWARAEAVGVLRP